MNIKKGILLAMVGVGILGGCSSDDDDATVSAPIKLTLQGASASELNTDGQKLSVFIVGNNAKGDAVYFDVSKNTEVAAGAKGVVNLDLGSLKSSYGDLLVDGNYQVVATLLKDNALQYGIKALELKFATANEGTIEVGASARCVSTVTYANATALTDPGVVTSIPTPSAGVEAGGWYGHIASLYGVDAYNAVAEDSNDGTTDNKATITFNCPKVDVGGLITNYTTKTVFNPTFIVSGKPTAEGTATTFDPVQLIDAVSTAIELNVDPIGVSFPAS
jgi:hypothetical protein